MSELALSTITPVQEYTPVIEHRKTEKHLKPAEHVFTPTRSEVERKVDALQVIDLGKSPAYIMQFNKDRFTSLDQVKQHIEAVVNGPRSQGIVTMLQDGGFSIAGYALNGEQMDYLDNLAQEHDAIISYGVPSEGDTSRVTFDPAAEDPDICLLSSSVMAAARTLDQPGGVYRLDPEGEEVAKGDRAKRIERDEISFPPVTPEIPAEMFEPYNVDVIQEERVAGAWVGQLDLNGSSEEYQWMLLAAQREHGDAKESMDRKIKEQIGGFLQIKEKLSALGIMTADIAGDNITYVTKNHADADLISQLVEAYYGEVLPRKPLKNVMEEIRRTTIYSLGDRVVGLSRRLDHWKSMKPVEKYHKYSPDTESQTPAVLQYRSGEHGMTIEELQEAIPGADPQVVERMKGDLSFKQELAKFMREKLLKMNTKSK